MRTGLRITAILLCIFLLAGCGAKDAVEPSVPAFVEVPEVSENNEIDVFFEKYVDTDQRPIGVMIDNDDKNARPHAGLEEAYLVYEMVVEGGATRFFALFRNDQTAKIGPVRSSRHYFLDYAMENDTIYTHFGWSPRAMSDISAYRINNINGVAGPDSDIYWREEKYRGDWHSAYTSIERITKMAEQKGYSLKTDKKNGLIYAREYFDLSSGESATDVKLEYSGRYSTGYVYDAEKKIYEKQIDGQPHKVQSGAVVEAKNIIVVLANDTSLGDGTARRNLINVGSGKGYYITNGKYEEITWSKSARNGDTVFTKTDGTPLEINPGKTYINIISPASKIIIQ